MPVSAERLLAEEALTELLIMEAALGIMESAETARLSVTHAPIGKGGKNWITKLKPGNKGQLPAYIQNVRNAIMRGGKDESEATEIAIGRVRDWAEGKGDVSPEVRAAAQKAIAEWEKDKAQNKARSKVSESAIHAAVLEAMKDADGDKPNVFCPKCKKKVSPTDGGKCPDCGTDLSGAIKTAAKIQEAVLSSADRKKLSTSDFALPPDRYPIPDLDHARNALARCAGKPEEARVKAAVHKKYPQLKPDGGKK